MLGPGGAAALPRLPGGGGLPASLLDTLGLRQPPPAMLPPLPRGPGAGPARPQLAPNPNLPMRGQPPPPPPAVAGPGSLPPLPKTGDPGPPRPTPPPNPNLPRWDKPAPLPPPAAPAPPRGPPPAPGAPKKASGRANRALEKAMDRYIAKGDMESLDQVLRLIEKAPPSRFPPLAKYAGKTSKRAERVQELADEIRSKVEYEGAPLTQEMLNEAHAAAQRYLDLGDAGQARDWIEFLSSHGTALKRPDGLSVPQAVREQWQRGMGDEGLRNFLDRVKAYHKQVKVDTDASMTVEPESLLGITSEASPRAAQAAGLKPIPIESGRFARRGKTGPQVLDSIPALKRARDTAASDLAPGEMRKVMGEHLSDVRKELAKVLDDYGLPAPVQANTAVDVRALPPHHHGRMSLVFRDMTLADEAAASIAKLGDEGANGRHTLIHEEIHTRGRVGRLGVKDDEFVLFDEDGDIVDSEWTNIGSKHSDGAQLFLQEARFAEEVATEILARKLSRELGVVPDVHALNAGPLPPSYANQIDFVIDVLGEHAFPSSMFKRTTKDVFRDGETYGIVTSREMGNDVAETLVGWVERAALEFKRNVDVHELHAAGFVRSLRETAPMELSKEAWNDIASAIQNRKLGEFGIYRGKTK